MTVKNLPLSEFMRLSDEEKDAYIAQVLAEMSEPEEKEG